MAIHPKGLGKGLDALIRETHETGESSGVQMLRLENIVPNPRQPRRNFSDKALEELAASIRGQGLLQPLLVRPIGPSAPGKFEIVAGERRWRASRLAGLTEAPVLVRSFSAQDTLAAALIENLQREDLNPIEEALGLQMLKDEFGLSQDDLAQKIGKSRPAIANSLRLLALPESMQHLLAEGKLSAGHARALLGVTDARAQEYAKNLILEQQLSVREAEGLVAGWKAHGRFELSGITPDGRFGQEASLSGDGAPHAENSPAEPVSAHAGPGPDADRPKKSQPQSARILEIQNIIGNTFQIPVRVTGKESRGKISFSYNSKEELDILLEKLTVPALAGANHASLPGNRLAELPGTRREALGARESIPLESTEQGLLPGTNNAGIVGGNNPALTGRQGVGIAGTERVKLSGTERQAVRGASAPELPRQDAPILKPGAQKALEGTRLNTVARSPGAGEKRISIAGTLTPVKDRPSAGDAKDSAGIADAAAESSERKPQ
jgi:ParB family chromosome partitioning protein